MEKTTKAPAAPLSATAYRNRQALMNKVRRFWIQGVLEHSLHGQVLLTLGLEESAEAVALPWNISWQTAAQPARHNKLYVGSMPSPSTSPRPLRPFS